MSSNAGHATESGRILLARDEAGWSADTRKFTSETFGRMNDASVLDAGVFPAMRHGGAEARATLPLSRRLAQLRIAAIIPLYNGGRFIREALESVLAQTLPPAEIVVVDDGSTDNGPDIVAEMAATHPISLLRKPNGGQASARNFGIAETSSELIALLDQDDACTPITSNAWHGRSCAQRSRPSAGSMAISTRSTSPATWWCAPACAWRRSRTRSGMCSPACARTC